MFSTFFVFLFSPSAGLFERLLCHFFFLFSFFLVHQLSLFHFFYFFSFSRSAGLFLAAAMLLFLFSILNTAENFKTLNIEKFYCV
jgi:hypothetical protein